MDEYGFSPLSICALHHGFWSDIKKPGRFDKVRDDLAELRLPIHVTKYIAKLSDNRVGKGATKCKCARPRIEHQRAEVPKATKQTNLASFFKGQ